jgi:hypothetical protein
MELLVADLGHLQLLPADRLGQLLDRDLERL